MAFVRRRPPRYDDKSMKSWGFVPDPTIRIDEPGRSWCMSCKNEVSILARTCDWCYVPFTQITSPVADFADTARAWRLDLKWVDKEWA
jgi:hypothetical protein